MAASDYAGKKWRIKKGQQCSEWKNMYTKSEYGILYFSKSV